MRRVALAVILACIAGATFASQVDAGGQVCTEIGCSSSINLHVREEARQEPAAALVRICALGICRERPTTISVVLPCGGVKSEHRTRVRVAVFDEDHKVLWRDATRALLERNQPNGPNCPPVCFQAALELVPATHEVRQR